MLLSYTGGGESPTFTTSNSEEESKIKFYFLIPVLFSCYVGGILYIFTKIICIQFNSILQLVILTFFEFFVRPVCGECRFHIFEIYNPNFIWFILFIQYNLCLFTF